MKETIKYANLCKLGNEAVVKRHFFSHIHFRSTMYHCPTSFHLCILLTAWDIREIVSVSSNLRVHYLRPHLLFVLLLILSPLGRQVPIFAEPLLRNRLIDFENLNCVLLWIERSVKGRCFYIDIIYYYLFQNFMWPCYFQAIRRERDRQTTLWLKKPEETIGFALDLKGTLL